MQPQLPGLHAIGQVGLQRAHRAAPAHAGTHANAGVQVAHTVGHGASIYSTCALPPVLGYLDSGETPATDTFCPA